MLIALMQEHDSVGVDIDGGDDVQDIAQRAEGALRVVGHPVDLAVDPRLDTSPHWRDSVPICSVAPDCQ